MSQFARHTASQCRVSAGPLPAPAHRR